MKLLVAAIRIKNSNVFNEALFSLKKSRKISRAINRIVSMLRKRWLKGMPNAMPLFFVSEKFKNKKS